MVKKVDYGEDFTIDGSNGDITIGNFKFDGDQTVGAGQDNYVLTYDDGSGLITLEASGAGTPAGSNTEIQFNNSGSFGASSNFYFSSNRVYIGADSSGFTGLRLVDELDATKVDLFYNDSNGETGLQMNGGGNAGITGPTGATMTLGSASGQPLYLTPGTTGDLILDGLKWPQSDGSADQVLKTDGAGQLSWDSLSFGALGDLSDVTETAVTNDEVLQYTGSGWENQTLAEAGIQPAGSYLENVSEDSSPSLSGDLDVNGNSIVSVSGGDIAISPDTTGDIILDGLKWPQSDGSADQVLKTDGAGQLSWDTLSFGALGDLSDVTETAVTNDEVLQYTGSGWENQTLAEAGIQPAGSYLTTVQASDVDAEASTDGYVLTSDGAGNAAWEAVSAVTPAGSNTEIQFNNSGSFGASSNFYFSSNRVYIGADSSGFAALRLVDESDATKVDLFYNDSTGETALQMNGGGNASISGATNADIAVTPNGTGKTKITNLEAATPINAQTGTSYTAVLADADKMITLSNASAIAMTIPANASVAYPVGTKLNFMQLGAGQVTVGITSDTLNKNSDFTAKLAGQYSVATAFKVTSTTWTLYGDLEAA